MSKENRSSPIKWFPREKNESFLERKIRLLQEKDGGSFVSLDETLENAPSKLSRIERDKYEAKLAADEATETRHEALVEASWCRILDAAGVPSAEAFEKAKETEIKASRASERASEYGVVLRDRPIAGQSYGEEVVLPGGVIMNDAILASVTNVREVEKEVVLAVKKALQVVEKEERAKLEEKEESVLKGSQTSEKMEKEVEEREEIVGKTSDLMTEEKNEAGIEEFSKEEHGENSNDEMVELGESQDDFLKGDFLSKLEQVKENSEEQEENEAENGLNADKVEGIEEEKIEEFETHYFSPASFLSGEKLVEITSTGIKERPPWKNVDLPDCTQLGEKFEKLTLSESGEKEMSNDCLETPKEVPQKSTFDLELRTEKEDLSGIENVMFQRVSLLNLEQRLALGAIVATRALVSGLLDELKEVRESGIRRVSSGGLGQVLKKHVSRLEAEKTAAALERAKGSESVKKIPKKPEEAVDSLSFVLKKHVSRLERDLQNSKISERSTMKARSEAISGSEGGGGLGDVLVKHKSKLQKEIEAAKSQGSGSRSHSKQTPHNLGGKGLGETLVKHKSRLERDIERNKGKDSFSKKDSKAPDGGKMEEFGEVLVKHKSKLQREQELFKMESEEQENEKPGKSEFEKSGKIQVEEGSGLGDILVKRVSRLEQMKADRKNQEISRKGKKATVEVGWEGVGLGDVLSKKVSRLEREKAAWKEAEKKAGSRI